MEQLCQYINDLSDGYEEKVHSSLTQPQKVNALPLEDTVWYLGLLIDLEDETEEDVCQSVAVMDRGGLVLGFCLLSFVGYSRTKACRAALCVSALHPLAGPTRKPLHVILSAELESLVPDLCITDLGMQLDLLADGEPCEKPVPCTMRQCSVCRKRGSKALFKTCGGCQVMLYCSRACQKTDWSRVGGMRPHSHKVWCSKMKSYLALAPKLAQFPFSFAAESTSPEFNYKSFLRRCGVYNEGVWCRETHFFHNVPYGDLPESVDAVVLPVESTVLDDPPADRPAPDQLLDWQSYYTYRGLRCDSPVAIILQWPLTLHYLINSCLPQDYPSMDKDANTSPLCVDIIGVEKEVDMLPVFKELGYLNPALELDVIMYGIEISKTVDKKQVKFNNITITIVRGVYHLRAKQERKPHLVVGFNAGLGAYQQWKDTLVKIIEDRVPAYFSDYCQYSCQCARNAIESLGVMTSDPKINPFRSPVRKLAEENEMPWYSNGFLFRLIYC